MLQTGFEIKRQVALPIIYKEIKLEEGYRMDFLIEKKVVVEIKSVEALNEVHAEQVLTYLKLSGAKIGLRTNFNVLKLTNGLKRFIGK